MFSSHSSCRARSIPTASLGDRWQRWAFGQRPAVGATEPQLAVGLSLDLIALLVDRAMMTPTEQGEVRERRGASVSPVADVMTLTEP